MNFDHLIVHLTDFYHGHTILAIVLAVVIVLLICFRPQAMLKTIGILAALAVVVYSLSLAIDMARSGRSHKKEMIQTER